MAVNEPNPENETLNKRLDWCHGNKNHIIQHQPEIFNLFERTFKVFFNFGNNLHGLDGEEYLNVSFFYNMAFGSFVGAARMLLGGQLAPAFMVMRGLLENALYGHYIFHNEGYFEIWESRIENERPGPEFIKTFKPAKMIESLKKESEDLGDRAKLLYDQTIDFGAHPNPSAFYSDVEWQDSQNQKYTFHWITHLKKDPAAFVFCSDALIKTGAVVLAIFRLIFKECFQILGLSEEIDELLKQNICLEAP